jgi:hypothetical protein
MNQPVIHKEIKLKRGAFHPPTSTGRMEGVYHKDLTKWAPMVRYNMTLKEVKEQMTPSEL